MAQGAELRGSRKVKKDKNMCVLFHHHRVRQLFYSEFYTLGTKSLESALHLLYFLLICIVKFLRHSLFILGSS